MKEKISFIKKISSLFDTTFNFEAIIFLGLRFTVWTIFRNRSSINVKSFWGFLPTDGTYLRKVEKKTTSC